MTEWTEAWTSYSALTQHRVCPQRFNYDRIRRLEPLPGGDPKVERDFGQFWHALRAADALNRGRALGSLQVYPEGITLGLTTGDQELDPQRCWPEVILDLAGQWWSQHADDRISEWDDKATRGEEWISRIGQDLPTRLSSLFDRWQEQWAEQLTYEFPLAVEQKWRRVLPALEPPLNYPPAPTATLSGYVDEVYRDERRALVVVRDHKVHKTLGTQTTADDMMDSQLQLYAWGVSPTVTSWNVGKIGATAYDRSRMVAPHPPTLTKSGRLAVRDGQPSVSSSDLHTYVEWAKGPDGQGVPYPGLKADGSGAGLYVVEQALVEKLSTPASRSVWFQRTLTPLNRNLILAHLRACVDSSADIAVTRARVEVSSEAARNLSTATCRYCEFSKLCRAEMVGGPGGDYDLGDMGLQAKPSRKS